MGDLGNLSCGQNAALVILAFLQTDCRTSPYGEELLSLGKDFNLTRDVHSTGDLLEDGDLETDGHVTSCITAALSDIQPSVELQWPREYLSSARIKVTS